MGPPGRHEHGTTSGRPRPVEHHAPRPIGTCPASLVRGHWGVFGRASGPPRASSPSLVRSLAARHPAGPEASPPSPSWLGGGVSGHPGLPATVSSLAASRVAEPPRRAGLGVDEQTFDTEHDLAPTACATEHLFGSTGSVTRSWCRPSTTRRVTHSYVGLGHGLATLLGPSGRASFGFSRRRYDSPSITSSNAALWRRSMADWASMGSAMSASHSLGHGWR